MQTPSDNYEIIIQPSSAWWRLDWRELSHYRDLLFLLVRRDFVAKYKQTILGPAWFIIQPLLTTIVFTVIFGKVAKISTDGMPPMLFYLCGMLGWQYFAQCLQGTSQTFVQNARLFGKVYFPRLVVPTAVVISNLLAFGIQFLTFLCFWTYFKWFTPAGPSIHPHLMLLTLPLVLIQTAAIGLGVGLWMSALTAKYRDFAHLSGFLTQLWMYATPVVYPLSVVPERYRWLSALNPMTMIIESYRIMFLGVGSLEAGHVLISVAITLLLLVSGVLIFSKTEKTFIDTV